MSNPNILLIVLDSVRARNVSLYGYDRDTTPFLDSFSERSTVYYQARSPGRWSLPSHASLFTGLHVAEHRLFDEGLRLEPGHTIFEELQNKGYSTGVFSYNGYINGATHSGLDRFETVEGYRDPPFPEAADPQGIRGQHKEFLYRALSNGQPVRSLLNGALMKLGWDYPDIIPDKLLRTTSAGKTPDDVYVDLFLDWEAKCQGSWAACLNLMCTHNAYDPAPEYDRWDSGRAREIQQNLEFGNWEFLSGEEPLENLRILEDLYDGTIREADSYVQQIIETLDERDDLEDTLVIITGDHGEGFGNPDEIRPNLPNVQHVVGSNEELLHVPLIVNFPGQTQHKKVENIATLTRFPNVVHNVLAGDWEHDAFTPDNGYVISSTHGLNEVNWERMLEFCDGDPGRFEGDTNIVYKDGEDGAVKKMINWKNRHVTLRIEDPYTIHKTESNNREYVSNIFDGVENKNVISNAEQAIDEQTESRLEALGYR